MESELSPLDLLRETQRIEKELGRTAKTTTEYADRVIDIDIIDYDNQIIKISQQSTVNSLLTLPHPLMHLRNFVLYPLADIAPEWVHPILKLTTLELKAKSGDKSIPYKK
jgi:2-amino-4-hydroxy-6-hydroxymethyldihydropteridine diphosphokinase